MKKLVLITFLFPLMCFSQVNIDSLWRVWSDVNQPDTNRLEAIKQINKDHYLFKKPDSSFYLAEIQYDLAKEKNIKKYMASALNMKGMSFYSKGEYDDAIDYYTQGLKIEGEIGDKKGVAKSLNNIGIIYQVQGDYSKCVEYYTKSLKIKEEIGDKKGIANSLNNIGNIYSYQGDYVESIDNYTQSLNIYEEMGDKKGIARSLNNIGVIYKQQANYVKAIDYYTQSLKIKEEIGDKAGIANSVNNIGSIYQEQGDYIKAIEYYTRSLKIEEEIGDKNGIAISFNNIGIVYKELGDYTEAIGYHTKSLEIREEIGDKSGIAISFNNIGSVYQKLGDYTEAIGYHTKSLKIREEIGDKKGIATSFTSIGKIYNDQGEYIKAHDFCFRALKIAEEIGAASETKNAAGLLWKINKKMKHYKDALEMHELYIVLLDSIKSQENQQEVIRQEFKYNYEKKEVLANARHEAEMQQQEIEALAEKKQQNVIIVSISVGFVLLALFLVFVFNRLKVTKRQRNKINYQKVVIELAHKKTEKQKYIIEEAHTQIKDSINYAKRLQEATLPSFEEVNQYLPRHFIFYKPKDLVSGDFYWFEQLNSISYLAVADCTGHGVPGAMLSVVCSNALNRSVKEFGITAPSKILDKTRELVIETFAKSGEGVQDGMDIALCAFDVNKVIYSGANNPLWILRKTDLLTQEQKENKSTITENELSLIEYKADKQHVGFCEAMKNFTQKEIGLFPGDNIYFFTDGFTDQFGGEKGKKFKYRPFKHLLVDLYETPIKEQAQIISNEFENWRGNLEQIDDVCVIGVKME